MINRLSRPIRSFASEGRSGGGRSFFASEPLYRSSCSGTIAGNGRHGVDDYEDVMAMQSAAIAPRKPDFGNIGPVAVFMPAKKSSDRFPGMPYRDSAVMTEADLLVGDRRSGEIGSYEALLMAGQPSSIEHQLNHGWKFPLILVNDKDSVIPGQELLHLIRSCARRQFNSMVRQWNHVMKEAAFPGVYAPPPFIHKQGGSK